MRIIRNADPGPFKSWSTYKPHLQRLFRHRCAYCLSHEKLMSRFDAMEVDHFRPTGRSEFAHLKCAWANLYYCCRRCNQHKWRKWPNADDLENGRRFVDPCEEDPDEHFRLTRDESGDEDGKIASKTPAGRYSIAKIRLNRRQLIDIRRDIARGERAARERLNSIDGMISSLGAPAQSASGIAELKKLRKQEWKSLEEIQALRPFPLAEKT